MKKGGRAFIKKNHQQLQSWGTVNIRPTARPETQVTIRPMAPGLTPRLPSNPWPDQSQPHCQTRHPNDRHHFSQTREKLPLSPTPGPKARAQLTISPTRPGVYSAHCQTQVDSKMAMRTSMILFPQHPHGRTAPNCTR